MGSDWRDVRGPLGPEFDDDRFYETVNGVSYHGYDSGGVGEVMLFLHGWPDDSSLWRHQYAAAKAAGYRAVVIDWIGHGASERVTEAARYDRSLLSRDLAALIALRNYGQVHCVAHDYGAVVAWEFCTLYPDLIRSFCALSIGHPVAIMKNPSFMSAIKNWFLIYNALPFAVRGYKARNAAFFRWAMKQHPDQDQVVSILQQSPHPFYIQAWELGNPPGPLIRAALTTATAKFPKLSAPTRGIWGSKDCFADEGQMKHSGALVANDFDFVRLDGLGHWLQLEDPKRLSALILEWAAAHRGQMGKRA
jgi:epoxide hydrolase 4